MFPTFDARQPLALIISLWSPDLFSQRGSQQSTLPIVRECRFALALFPAVAQASAASQTRPRVSRDLRSRSALILMRLSPFQVCGRSRKVVIRLVRIAPSPRVEERHVAICWELAATELAVTEGLERLRATRRNAKVDAGGYEEKI